jgi:uncharacterized protein YgfB (UPF0149 family)
VSEDAELPDYAAVCASVAHGGIDASDLHGLICGYLASGASLEGAHWPERLQLSIPTDAILNDLCQASAAGLSDLELGFQLLLPPDEVAVIERAQALFNWCRGFVAGFALSPTPAALSEEAREAFEDMAEIAAFVPQDDEQDEQALLEVSEFARLAALLIHGDVLLANRRRDRLH